MLRMPGPPRLVADASLLHLDGPSPYLRLQSVTVFVRDIDRSLPFYLDQLGFQLVFDGRSNAGNRWVSVAPPDGTANLTLVAPEKTNPQHKLIGRRTQVTFVTEDVTAKFREWLSRGVVFEFTPRLRRLRNSLQPRFTPSSTSPSGNEAILPATDAPPPARAQAPVWGGVFTRFHDPDGNSFSLVSFDEVTHAVEAQRRSQIEKLERERRAAQELEIATQVQARLFPQTLPPLKTLEYAGICHQARQVGGDYYDFLDLGNNRMAFVIGDISGKGIAAALLMANLQANLRSQSAIAFDQPQILLRAVNRLFCENTVESAFATLFFGEYDDSSSRLRYVNCGHLPALLLHTDDSVERLSATATILGIFKTWDCEIGEARLSPGDAFALYTDGITESFNHADEQFGEARLLAALSRHRALCCESMLTAVVNEVRQFTPHEQSDDITLIVAKCPQSSA
jgi:phosphoserine phosphatase RsbU/P